MNTRLRSIIRKEFIQIFRDKRTLAIILLIPIMQLFLLGYAATNDIRNIPLVVFDQCRCSESRDLINAYNTADYFQIDPFMPTPKRRSATLIQAGTASAALIIPPDYNTRLVSGDAQVAFILDGSNPTSASTAYSAAILIGQSHATTLMVEKLSRAGINVDRLTPPLEVRPQVWYNPDLVSSYFMIPGVIGMILFAITSILTATSVVRERERGTIEQLIVTPIRPWELVLGKILPYVILAFIDTFEVLALGHWVFGVPIRGSIWLIILSSGLLLLSGLGIGLVRLHHCQHPAGSHADRMDDPAAFHLHLRFLLPPGSHAASAALGLRHRSAALLPANFARGDAQGIRLERHLGGVPGVICIWRSHFRCRFPAIPQASGLVKE